MEINQLPDEVILHILSFLTPNDWFRTCAVCSRWRHLSTLKSLWRNASLLTGEENFSRILRKAPILKDLYLHNLLSSEDEKTIPSVLNFRGELGKLDLDYCAFNVKDISNILNCFAEHLEELHFFETEILSQDSADDQKLDINPVTGSFPNLKVLSLNTNFYFWYPKGTQKPDWPKLEELRLDQHFCHSMTQETVKHCLAAVKDQIKKLEVYFSDITFLREFDARLFPKLEYLFLCHKPVNITHDYHNNSYLKLDFGSENDIRLIVNVGSVIPYHCEELNSDCNVVQRVIESFSHVNVVDFTLSFGPKAGDCLAHLFTGFQQLKQLRLVHVCEVYYEYDYRYFQLKLDILLKLLANFPNLIRFSLKAGLKCFSEPPYDFTFYYLRERFPNVEIQFEITECKCKKRLNYFDLFGHEV